MAIGFPFHGTRVRGGSRAAGAGDGPIGWPPPAPRQPAPWPAACARRSARPGCGVLERRRSPPCDSATARTIERPEAAGGAAVARAAHEALEDALAQLGRRRPGPSSSTTSSTSPSRVSVRAWTRRARRACGAARSRSGSAPGGAARRARRRPSRASASMLEVVVARRPGRARRPPRRGPCRGRSARGALAVGVGAGEQQQVGDEAAHPLRRAQRRARGLAALAVEHLGEQLEVGEDAGQRRAQLVRGVGDELALARAASPRSRRATPRAPSSIAVAASGPARRPRRRRRGWGIAAPGVAGALDVARGGGQRGDRAHRAARQRRRRRASASSVPPRRRRPGRAHARRRCPRGRRPCARTGRARGRPTPLPDPQRDVAGLDAEAGDAGAAVGQREAEVRGVRRSRRAGVPSLSSTRIVALFGALNEVRGPGCTVTICAVRESTVEAQLVAQAVDGGGQLVVEVRADAARRSAGRRRPRTRRG